MPTAEKLKQEIPNAEKKQAQESRQGSHIFCDLMGFIPEEELAKQEPARTKT